MVNTRRSESIGATQDSNNSHQSMKNDDDSSSDDGESADLDATWSQTNNLPRTRSSAPRVRELRSRFAYKGPRVRARKRISIDEHLSVYASRNMHESELYNGNDSEEDLCSRVRKQSRKAHLRNVARIERRTALSLRPISGKCYADSNSETELRRRSFRRSNMSWLNDAQMHKMGYPNLNATGYSEEDSRDIQLPHHEETRRITRHNKNSKYGRYKYENADSTSRATSRRTTRQSNREVKNLREDTIKESDDEANDEDDEEEEETNKNEDETMGEESNDAPSSNKSPQENGVATKQEEDDSTKDGCNEDNQENKEESFNSSIRRNTRAQYKRVRKNKQPFVDSSSSESENKTSYSLRKRAPKPPPMSMKSSVMRTNHEMPRSRRRFTTRRRKVSSSSSSSSSSSEERRTPNRYTKSPHSKNEQKMKSGAGGSKIIPIGPETLDIKVRFSSIGGLDDHIQCLKEMVLLPMMYPEVFRNFQIQPPRGVLFHGPPGTGKTLIARALANECSQGLRKVSFFMRKGADLLSKWIGESEKQLRLLFEQAAEMQPSIIFFDELDGLAPVRSSRQDQVHASIVSTLLALMDGLDNRGEVIVIGATNRIDAIDPALRRPGRFDRELFFPLPAKTEREAILKVHVSQWSAPPNDQLVSYLAEQAVGYCGSDLRALCSEAVIQAFRRTYPQVYGSEHRLLLDADKVHVEKIDFLRAKSSLVPAAHRVAQGLGKRLLAILEPLLGGAMEAAFERLVQIFPHALKSALSKVKLSPNLRPAQLLILGQNADSGQTTHLAPAILYRMEHIHAYNLDLATMFKETGRSPDEICLQVFNEARRNVPSVIYIPNIDNWWELMSDTVKSILESQISQLDPYIPILILATADATYEGLPEEIKNMFTLYRREFFQLETPNESCRRAFFKPLLIDTCLKWIRPKRKRPVTPPPLPRAPTPPPTPLSDSQVKKLYEHEEHTMRELRIFLRDVCKKLANNKLFFMFTKPVDTEEVPDYMNIIKEPMDLETMMTKVDFHRYECARDFLKDIELIVHNALEYNPARTSADKQIRHRACSLRDYAYALIKTEMDTDFEEKCQEISSKRSTRKVSTNTYLPAYIQTPDIKLNPAAVPDINEPTNSQESLDTEKQKSDENLSRSTTTTTATSTSTSSGKKRRLTSWQRGFVKKRKKNKESKSILEGPELKKDSDDNSNSKENSSSIMDASCAMDTENGSSFLENSPTKPLSIHCDDAVDITKMVGSPRRLLNDLMSPSELLENPLDFDDIDQALNEDVQSNETRTVQCSKSELEATLDKAVSVTAGFSLQSLLDLYNHLNSIVKKYANTHVRNHLPEELQTELERFRVEANPESRESSPSPQPSP